MHVKVGNTGDIKWSSKENGQTETTVSIPLIFENINKKPIGIKKLIINRTKTEIKLNNEKLNYFEIIDKFFAFEGSTDTKLTPTEVGKIFKKNENINNLQLRLTLVIESEVSNFSNSSWELFFEIEFYNGRLIEWEVDFNNRKDSNIINNLNLQRITHRPITLYNLVLILFLIAILSLYTYLYADLPIHSRVFFLNSKFLSGVIGALLAFFGLTMLQVKENFTTKRKLTSFIEYPELNIDINIFKDLESKTVFRFLVAASILTPLFLFFFIPIDITEYQKDRNIVIIDKYGVKSKSHDIEISHTYIYWYKLAWFKNVTINLKVDKDDIREIGILTIDWITATHESKKIVVECSPSGKTPLTFSRDTLNLYDLIINNSKLSSCSDFDIKKYLVHKETNPTQTEKERLNKLDMKVQKFEPDLSYLQIGKYQVLSLNQILERTDNLKDLFPKGQDSKKVKYLFDKKDSLINDFTIKLNVSFNETVIKRDTLVELFKVYTNEIAKEELADKRKKQIIERCIILSSTINTTRENLEEGKTFGQKHLDILLRTFKDFYPLTTKGYEPEVAQSILGMLVNIGKNHYGTESYINTYIIDEYLSEKIPEDKDIKGDYYGKRLGYIFELAINGLLNSDEIGQSEKFMDMTKKYIDFRGDYLDRKDYRGFIAQFDKKPIFINNEKAKNDFKKYFEYFITNYKFKNTL